MKPEMKPEMTFGWDSVADLLDEPNLTEMVLAQHEELGWGKLPLEVDTERMRGLEKLGLFRIWAARSDGLLVGMIEFNIMTHPHHRSTLMAFDGGHYLHPEFRSGFGWIKMWRSALDALQDLGVVCAIAHDNPARPLGAGFARLGFEPAGSIYRKVLAGG